MSVQGAPWNGAPRAYLNHLTGDEVAKEPVVFEPVPVVLRPKSIAPRTEKVWIEGKPRVAIEAPTPVTHALTTGTREWVEVPATVPCDSSTWYPYDDEDWPWTNYLCMNPMKGHSGLHESSDGTLWDESDIALFDGEHHRWEIGNDDE